MSTRRRAGRCTPAIAAVACVFAIAVSAFAADGKTKTESTLENPCDYGFNEMVLKRTWKESGLFYGAFDIRIATVEKRPVVISGTRGKAGFRVGGPEVSFEFRDANGQWNERLRIPGTYLGDPDTLSITQPERAEIVALLPDPQSAELAGAWRLVLRSKDNSRCMKSLPFRVKQKRGPVEGFVSEPEPDYWKNAKPCPCGSEVKK